MTQKDRLKVAIVGAGYMGGGIAQVLALAGHECRLADMTAEASSSAFQRVIEDAAMFEHTGLLESGSADKVAYHLSFASDLSDACADADYVVEAVPEAIEIKTAVLESISACCPSDAIISSNTSAIPMRHLAGSVTHPQRFMGVHWMNPAQFIPGVELVAGPQTDVQVIEQVRDLLAEAGKTPVSVSDSAGFVSNRLQFALFREAAAMVEEGLVSPEDLDSVVSNCFGFRLALYGPFAIADGAGLDVYEGSYKSLEAAYGDRFSCPPSIRDRVKAGVLGIKSGEGFLGEYPSDGDNIGLERAKAYHSLLTYKRNLMRNS